MNGVDNKADDLHILPGNGEERDDTKGNSMVPRS